METASFSSLRRYGVAVGVTILAVLVREGLTPVWGTKLPFLTLFPAVLLSAWYGGVGPGLLTTLLCTLAAVYLWLPPQYALAVGDVTDQIGLALAVFVMLLFVALTAARRRAEATVRAQHAQLEVTLHSLGEAVIVTDHCGRVTRMNALAQALAGRPLEEAFGKALSEVLSLFNEDTGQPVANPVTAVLREGTVVNLAPYTVVRAQDGHEIALEGAGAPIRDAHDTLHGVVLVLRDITARRRAEAALRLSEERFAKAFRASPDVLVLSREADGRILEVNDRWEKLFGSSPHEVVGQSSLALDLFVQPTDRHRVVSMLQAQGSVRDFALDLRRRSGEVRHASLSVERFQYAGEPCMLTIIRDTTESKRAEDRVQQQLARLSLLHDITRAIGERQDLRSILLVILGRLETDLPIAFGCVYLYDADREQLTVTALGPGSQAWTAALGMEEQAALPLDQNGLRACLRGQTVYEPDTSAVPFPLPQRLAQAGLRSAVATPLIVEGRGFGLLLAARREAAGFSSGESEFLRQLSEHGAMAVHHASLYAKLQRAYDDLRTTQQAVLQQERLRALGQMASGIAHDINNAISPIVLYIEALLANEPALSARGREYLTTIERAVGDIEQTVARLRQFYREPELAELHPVDLNRIVPQVVELTRARWRDLPQQGGMTISVRTELEAGLPPMLGSESELREALTNLIFNAVDAMPQGGTLTLRTRATTTQVSVEVQDTGVGMDEETRQRCLEPFYTSKGERGTGLGLAMVYGAMERHGAQMEIESAPGHGTAVRLLFPVAEEVKSQPLPRVSSERRAVPLRILVVDDDPLLRRSLQDVLQADGHVVTAVEGGAAGIAAFRAAPARQEAFDVVITDLGMPEMDGREVARVVKQEAPATPVVLLTGWGQQLREEGAPPPYIDQVLSKPPKLHDLRAALETVTAQREKEGSEEGARREGKGRGAEDADGP